MAYAIRMKFPQANGLGCVNNRFPSSEHEENGRIYFATHGDPLRAIRFDTEYLAAAFIRKYQLAGFIDPTYDWKHDKDKKFEIVKI